MVKEIIVEVLREGQIVQMPKSLANKEELFILREVREEINPIVKFPVYKTLRNARTSEKKWHSYQANYLKHDAIKDLVDNFHWIIMKARKDRGMNRKQLANAIAISESELSEIERGVLARDKFASIVAIEKYLGIKLCTYPNAILLSSVEVKPKTRYDSDVSLSDLQKMKEHQPGASKKTAVQTKEVEIF